MKYLNYYLDAFRNYVNFKGRADRAQYWWFFLFNLIIYIVLSGIGGSMTSEAGTTQITTGALASLYSLVVFLPGLAIAVRRLHDIGKSGAWVLITFIPFIGLIVLIVLLAKKGDSAPNMYGNPVGSGQQPPPAQQPPMQPPPAQQPPMQQ